MTTLPLKARWRETRQISKFLRVTGTLTLLTPARFGNGERDELTDMPLARDTEGRPLLPGSSLAGAMRAYLHEWEQGYEMPEARKEAPYAAQKLFGQVWDDKSLPEGEKASLESYLIVEDACFQVIPAHPKGDTEIRAGVALDPRTRTVKEKDGFGQLYDTELLAAGTAFTLSFELALPAAEEAQRTLRKGLAIALTGFERGEIGLGARKRRGFGECQVTQWNVQEYDLKNPKQLIAWLEGQPGKEKTGDTIASRLGVSLLEDQRKRFCLQACFQLETSLLIRSGGNKAEAPDMVHLRSRRPGGDKAILSGTSLAGALRARALRIAKTMCPAEAQEWIEALFGSEDVKVQAQRGTVKASRVVVREREVKGKNDLVQTRIRIDRFTGGTYPGGLFEQQPIFGGETSLVSVELELRNPDKTQIGLLLHLLKDLWTGDLPLGGDASVGRGRLKGLEAKLSLQEAGQLETWRIARKDKDQLTLEGDREKLAEFGKLNGDSYE